MFAQWDRHYSYVSLVWCWLKPGGTCPFRDCAAGWISKSGFTDLRWDHGWAVPFIFTSKYWAHGNSQQPRIFCCSHYAYTKAWHGHWGSSTKDVWPNHMVADCKIGSRSLHSGLTSWEFLFPLSGRRDQIKGNENSCKPQCYGCTRISRSRHD